MIDFTPPPYVQTTVSDTHRFIADELEPRQRDLAAHLTNEHLYLREDGRLAPEVLAAQRTIRKRSAERGFYALHMPKEVGGGGFSLTDMFFVDEAVSQHGIGITQWMLSRMMVDSYLDVQAMRSMSLQCLWQADLGESVDTQG